VTLAWWGFLAWLIWHVIYGQARALINERGSRPASTHKSAFYERGSVNVRFAPKATEVLRAAN
jgi:hypothetical protein